MYATRPPPNNRLCAFVADVTRHPERTADVHVGGHQGRTLVQPVLGRIVPAMRDKSGPQRARRRIVAIHAKRTLRFARKPALTVGVTLKSRARAQTNARRSPRNAYR